MTPERTQELASLGQHHLLDQLGLLDATGKHEARDRLDQQLMQLDLHFIREARDLLHQHLHGEAATAHDLQPGAMLELTSAGYTSQRDAAFQKGLELLRAGRVAVVLVAGGQGTRLGFDQPKGLFPIGPLTQGTLFEGYVRQLLGLTRFWDCPTPLLCVMTSDATHQATVTALDAVNWHGMPADCRCIFKQESVPALDQRGRVILETADTIAMSPNGHGGCVDALYRTFTLKRLAEQEIDWVFYAQVDNPAVRLCDPTFLGLCALQDAEVGMKVVAKQDPAEKVGVFGYRDGAPAVIEYSELSEAQSTARDASGALSWRAGNTAIHVFSRALLERAIDPAADSVIDSATEHASLPWHLAHKLVTQLGASPGDRSPNGYKFERFIFDLFPLAARVLALECVRDDEFLPVKSADGPTSPVAVQAALQELWRRRCHAWGIDLGGIEQIEIGGEFQLCDQLTGFDAAGYVERVGDALLLRARDV